MFLFFIFIINPKLSHGANIAERVPITILAFPVFIRFHSSKRSPNDNPLCKTATVSPKRDIKWDNVCGVDVYLGTITITCLPSLYAASTNFIKT